MGSHRLGPTFYVDRSFRFAVVVGLVLSWVTAPLCPEALAEDASFHRDVLPFLDQYCNDCHMADGAEGGIVLDGFRDRESAGLGGKTWLRVLDAVESGVMPPSNSDRPSLGESQRLLDWIQNDFFVSQAGHDSQSSAGVIRRLNRQEYNNTLRDLIGLELDLAASFPPDDIGFGFDNIGSALKTSPMHIERYLDAAELALQAAIVVPDVKQLPPVELIGLRTYPLTEENPVQFEHHLEPGRYLADFSLVRAGIDESAPPPRLLISFGKDRRAVDAERVQDETVVYRYWLTVAKGDNQVGVSLAQPAEASLKPLAVVNSSVSGDQRYGKNHGLHVDSMIVRGPVTLALDELPPSHKRLVFCTPDFGDASRMDCGRQVLERFAERAFRRPVSDGEVEPLMAMFALANSRGESFERACQVALSAVLVSPQFLFLIEPDKTAQDRLLSDYELASRLSYYLWSTMPDEQLLSQAAANTLRENLHSQVARMLADPKSQAFTENFVGQWLQLRNLEGVAPDEGLYPDFDDALKHDMRRETEHFFAHVLHGNRSVLDLLDSDYVFVNDRLARHYKMDGIAGTDFRRVQVDGIQRGGILTQGSILTLTSNHNRTSAVKRGQWIMQQLLGTPPPPPPPDVPELDESPQVAQSASLRERLEAHRANPECAACHTQMDPLGFALENYDAVGSWRENDGGFPIDASGELPGELRFANANELKKILRTTAARKFSWCLIENMLTYALGRNLEPADYRLVESIRGRLEKDDFRIHQIILGVVDSDAFQRRGVAR